MSKIVLYSHGNWPGDEKAHCEMVNMVGRNLDTVGYIPSTPDSLNYFDAMEKHYRGLGFKEVRCFDIHNNPNGIIMSGLLSCSAIHLSAGDPVYFSSCFNDMD